MQRKALHDIVNISRHQSLPSASLCHSGVEVAVQFVQAWDREGGAVRGRTLRVFDLVVDPVWSGEMRRVDHSGGTNLG